MSILCIHLDTASNNQRWYFSTPDKDPKYIRLGIAKVKDILHDQHGYDRNLIYQLRCEFRYEWLPVIEWQA